MLIEFTVQKTHTSGHEPRRPIWVRASTAPSHHRGVAVQGGLRSVAAVTCRDQVIHQRRQAESTRPALLHRLSSEPGCDPGEFTERARAVVDDEHDTGAECAAHGSERGSRQAQLAFRRHPTAVISTHDQSGGRLRGH
jgi:hypothetical protein